MEKAKTQTKRCVWIDEDWGVWIYAIKQKNHLFCSQTRQSLIQSCSESFLRSRRKEPAAKGETRSESFLRNSGENEASQQKDERYVMISNRSCSSRGKKIGKRRITFSPSRDSCGSTVMFCLVSQLAESRLIGTQDNILGVLTQPRRLDHNSLAGHHHQSKCTDFVVVC